LDRVIEGFYRKGEPNGEQDHAERDDPIMLPHLVNRAAQPSGDARHASSPSLNAFHPVKIDVFLYNLIELIMRTRDHYAGSGKS
jgi:hypothetical protein